jgi:hypothetical protein
MAKRHPGIFLFVYEYQTRSLVPHDRQKVSSVPARLPHW